MLSTASLLLCRMEFWTNSLFPRQVSMQIYCAPSRKRVSTFQLPSSAKRYPSSSTGKMSLVWRGPVLGRLPPSSYP